MSGCKSNAMDNLEAQVRKEDPENVLVSSLAYLTRTKSLYGGDLESTVNIMRKVASSLRFKLLSTSGSFHNKEIHVKQVVQDVLRAATNILEESNRRAWWDLSAQTRLKVATNLLLALEDNAFLLAGVVNEPSEILETHEIMSKYIGSKYMSLYILVSTCRFLHYQLTAIFVENLDKNTIPLLMIILHISTRHLSAKLTYIFYLLQTLLCFAPIYGAGRKISKK